LSTTDGALAEATGIAQAMVGDTIKVSRLVTGGRNSRIWRVASGERGFALKQGRLLQGNSSGSYGFGQ
jgi:hypothetical protein